MLIAPVLTRYYFQLLDSRKELNALGATVSEQRSKNTQLKREIMARNELTEKLKVDCESLTQKLKDLEGRSCSAVERKKQLENIYQVVLLSFI